MNDEKYVFLQEVREKKIVSRSSHNRRTHAGKGGAVKLPSDYMTRKELKAMNGEVKSYRLNEPMKWAEFKYMPDDIKISYVKLIRERFNVSDSCIARMLGISQNGFSSHIKRLGLGLGRGTGNQKSDKEWFLAWCNGAPIPACSDESVGESFVEDADKGLASLEDIVEPVPVVPEIKTLPLLVEKAKAIPRSGSMTFEGRVEDVLKTVAVLLGGAYSKICISWEVSPEDGVLENG